MTDLESNVQYLKGVGPRLASYLGNLGITKVRDLLFHFPFRYVDRRNILSIKDTPAGKEKTIIAEVVTSGISFLGKRRSRIFEVIATDGTGMLSAKWFHFHPKYMHGRFPKGSKVLFAGELTEYNNVKQFIHPEVEILNEDEKSEIGGKYLPIYPSTEGISQRTLRKIINSAVSSFTVYLENYIPSEINNKYHLESIKDAVQYLHHPPNDVDSDFLNQQKTTAHRTIKFIEFFTLELMLAIERQKRVSEKGISFKFDEISHSKFLEALPFKLTGAQEKVISEIRQDMERPYPMNRLLQGDVGSGKTVVGLAAALQAVGNGFQAAFMAPTEILAEQHYKTVSAITDKLQIPCALLTASIKGELRDSVYKGVSDGSIPILIGTHAIIQTDVRFKKLGLALIDEQHRFGVMQRQSLHKKGNSPDILVMTATPIPRTLAMTLYGDLEVSIIDQMPSGRKPIITKIYGENLRTRLYEGMKKELEKGHQIYLVYPLIEESEKVDLKNATEMSEELRKIFQPETRVELLHGRMKAEEKEKIMKDFKSGEIGILAATSVVEVGVDVPNASVMVIEHAERFGLAQLHQLRGRVGRGSAQSYCILMCGFRPGEEASKRLNIMVETNDGFKIAEADLEIRGPGEFLGTRQAGLPEFKLANLITDTSLLQTARQAAFEVMTEDPNMELPKNKKLFDHIKKEGRLGLGKVS